MTVHNFSTQYNTK